MPADIPTGPLRGREGYANPVGGWAEAARATEVGLKRVQKLGGEVRGGCRVVGLEKKEKRVEGVKLESGEVVKGDLIIVCPNLSSWISEGKLMGCSLPLVLGQSGRSRSCGISSSSRTPALCELPDVSVRMPEVQATGLVHNHIVSYLI